MDNLPFLVRKLAFRVCYNGRWMSDESLVRSLKSFLPKEMTNLTTSLLNRVMQKSIQVSNVLKSTNDSNQLQCILIQNVRLPEFNGKRWRVLFYFITHPGSTTVTHLKHTRTLGSSIQIQLYSKGFWWITS